MQVAIAHAMSKLDIKDTPWRFHGKASPHHLLLTFREIRYTNGSSDDSLLAGIQKNMRKEYWRVPEWEAVIASENLHPIDYSIWPEDDLARVLVASYFESTNFHLPLLNRTIFERQYASGLYKTNHDFAKVCLMVFANGARYVDDERVYWPVNDAVSEEGKERLRTDQDGTRKYSAGWIYLRALLIMGKSLMQGPNLYDFQCQVLFCVFLHGSAVPHLTWLCSGMGLRAAQEIGIHVRSILIHADPIERALFNRAFWCLYHIDRINCAGIGRSVALQDCDFDADYPIAVGDEYWDTGDPERNFKQPEDAGLPEVVAFIHLLKLDHIIGAALRTIYAINKTPEHRADFNGQRAIVVELDSALNSWADAVPDGLRWDPTRADQQLFEHSAVLYAHYYYCQILVHRPFIPTPKNPNAIGLPSLAICSNASRSICNILDAVLRRGRQRGSLPGRALNINFLLPAWIAAVVLLITIYSGKQQTQERERAIADVKRCISAMKEMELTFRLAGKLTDILMETSTEAQSLGDTPPQQGRKRTHEVLPLTPSASASASVSAIPFATNDTSSSHPPVTPPTLFGTGGMWPPGTEPVPDKYSGGGLDGGSEFPSFNGSGTEGLFDTSMFDSFYGSLGDLTGFDMPAVGTSGEEGDFWAQMLSGYA